MIVKLAWTNVHRKKKASLNLDDFKPFARGIIKGISSFTDNDDFWTRLCEFVDHPTIGKRYLFVTMRRIYAQSLYESIKKALPPELKNKRILAHYQEDVKTWSWNRLPEIFICNQESLWHIPKSDFDVVVLDETMSLIHNMFNEATHKQKLRANFERMMDLSISSKLLICMDAALGIDERFIAFVVDYFRRKQYYVNRGYYHFDVHHVKIHNYVKVKDENRRYLQWVTDSQAKDILINEYLKKGKKVLIPFRSKSGFEEHIQEHDDFQAYKDQMFFISSDMDSKEKKKLDDAYISGLFKKYQVVAFTSSITHGIDIQADVDSVFLFANYFSGPASEECIQMLGRARKVKENDQGRRPIYIVLPGLKPEPYGYIADFTGDTDNKVRYVFVICA